MDARSSNEREEARMAFGKKQFLSGALAFGFVIVTLVAWWLFASLAETVVNCVPWRLGGSCESPFTSRPRLEVGVRVSMLLVSLFAAIWVANRLFYSPDTYEPKPQAPGNAAQPQPNADGQDGHENEEPRRRAVNE